MDVDEGTVNLVSAEEYSRGGREEEACLLLLVI